MPEIVTPDLSHSLRLEQLRKALCDVVGLDQIANLIDTYILKIFLDVAASAQAAVFMLLFFQRKKSLPHERNKRQCPHCKLFISVLRSLKSCLFPTRISPRMLTHALLVWYHVHERNVRVSTV